MLLHATLQKANLLRVNSHGRSFSRHAPSLARILARARSSSSFSRCGGKSIRPERMLQAGRAGHILSPCMAADSLYKYRPVKVPDSAAHTPHQAALPHNCPASCAPAAAPPCASGAAPPPGGQPGPAPCPPWEGGRGARGVTGHSHRFRSALTTHQHCTAMNQYRGVEQANPTSTRT